ncbi:hypothetical protein [uncultured Chryseobacterium sp.]|uniref:hypothetical protein n=1 Tax=uncultured Chryseobacterium sp. TaxID=259322 RepID=UPI00262A50F9|nr:hypothetical protein [uncultured Chryseobacterium sp.]
MKIRILKFQYPNFILILISFIQTKEKEAKSEQEAMQITNTTAKNFRRRECMIMAGDITWLI